MLLHLLDRPADTRVLVCLLERPSQQLLLLPSCAQHTHSMPAFGKDTAWEHTTAAVTAQKHGAVTAHHQQTASLLTMASVPGCPASRAILRRGCQVSSAEHFRTAPPSKHSACQTKPQQPDSEPGGASGSDSPFSSSAHHLRNTALGRGSRHAECLSAASARDEPPTSSRS